MCSHLLLHKNALFRWFILVPETDVGDFLDLEPMMRAKVLDECGMISEFIKSHFKDPKINFAGIGNVVPQMHLHVIGRSPADPLWPAPVWGNVEASEDYGVERVEEIRAVLSDSFGLVAG